MTQDLNAFSLVLNKDDLKKLNEPQKRLFMYEWLCHVNKVLTTSDRADIKNHQKQMVEQLLELMSSSMGSPTRQLIGRSLALIFAVGDTFLLFDSVNKCNDRLKIGDSPTRLGAVSALGCMYEKLGRMMGRSYEESLQSLLKLLRNGDLETRMEVVCCLRKILFGVGAATTTYHKDISKSMKSCILDRSAPMRIIACDTLCQMGSSCVDQLEVHITLCLRAFEGSNYTTRLAIANLVAQLCSVAVKSKKQSLSETLNVLSSGFMKGTLGGLFKGHEVVRANMRDTRAGIAYAYVFFLDKMGGLFVERHFKEIMLHLISTVSNARTSQSHLDGVFTRTCINFIMRSMFCNLLSDKAQRSACRDLGHILLKQLNQKDVPANTLICIFEIISSIVVNLQSTVNSVIQDSSVGLVEITFSALTNTNSTVRIYAAYLLRWVTHAQPALLTPIMERCIDQYENMKNSPASIAGYSCGIASMLSSSDVTQSQLNNLRKYKLLFSISEEMLRSATHDPNVSLLRVQKGWLIMGSIMTLGPSTVRSLLPRLLLLWKSSFPRTQKDLQSEKSRGDSFTWECILESRAGALATMASFLKHCGELATEDIIRRLLSPVESALFMVSNLNDVIRQYGQQLKAGAAMVRLRLYQVLMEISPALYESSYNALLKLLVTDITLADHSQSTTTTSRLQLRYMSNKCYTKEEHKLIEEQAYSDGALEHDTTYLYKKVDNLIKKPLPLGVSLIDASVDLFGFIFPFVPDKHRQQVIQHFVECIKHNTKRAEPITTNILAGLLVSMKALVKSNSSLTNVEVAKVLLEFSLPPLSSSNEVIRHAAAEVVGYTVVAANSRSVVNDAWTRLMDVLKKSKDSMAKCGNALALGYLHRYTTGYMSDSQHFTASLKVLLQMSQDSTCSQLQNCALHGLNLVAYSGSSFRPHVEVALSLVLQLMLQVPSANVDVHQNLGRCLQAFIGTLGPELQVLHECTRLLGIGCSLLENHPSPVVRSEALGALQQLQLFAPKDIKIEPILSFLCSSLESDHVILRHAAIACLRQFLQRDPMDILQRIAQSPPSNDVNSSQGDEDHRGLPWDRGLILVVFSIMDIETEQRSISQLKDILISLLSLTCLADWLSICKQVLADSSNEGEDEDKLNTGNDEGESEDAEQQFQSTQEPETHPWVGPRWRTKVFALECVIKLIKLCDQDKTHFNMQLARESQNEAVTTGGKKSFLILHLSELIRMAFMACTSDSIQLTICGLKLLQMIIDRFADVPEQLDCQEFEEHVILEQYQAQVDAALRPAFSAGDTPSEITALACHVCSTWICSAVSKNLPAVQRVHSLLAKSLHKVMKEPSAKATGGISTLERLSVLKAWAEIYIAGKRQNKNLLSLIEADIKNLSQYWLALLKDYAMLGLPSSLSSQLPHDGGAFYSQEVAEHCKPYYRESWPPVLLASTLWLCNENGFELVRQNTDAIPQSFLLPKSQDSSDDITERWFNLLYSVCCEALYNRSEHSVFALQSVHLLIKQDLFDACKIDRQKRLGELVSILHRTLITDLSPPARDLVLDVALQVAEKLKNEKPSDAGTETGPAYSLLNLALCTAVIHCPELSEKLSKVVPRSNSAGSDSADNDIRKALQLLNTIPYLVEPPLAIELIPSILHINLTLLLYATQVRSGGALLQSFKTLCSFTMFEDAQLHEKYIDILSSALHKILLACSDDVIFNSVTKSSSVLLTVAIFICTAPAQISNLKTISEKVVDFYERALECDHVMIVKTAVGCARNIFSHGVHKVEFVLRWSEKVYAILLETQDATLAMECVCCLQTVLDITPDQHRMPILKILVTIVLSLAVKKTLTTQAVIEILTQRLSPFSIDIKTILNDSPALKMQLENLIKSQQAQEAINAKTSIVSKPTVIPKQPTIQLKSDFSNFIK